MNQHQQQLEELCKAQYDYTDKSYLPEHYFTNRYLLHKDKFDMFVSAHLGEAIKLLYKQVPYEYSEDVIDEMLGNYYSIEDIEKICSCRIEENLLNPKLTINFKR